MRSRRRISHPLKLIYGLPAAVGLQRRKVLQSGVKELLSIVANKEDRRLPIDARVSVIVLAAQLEEDLECKPAVRPGPLLSF
jgi:hypothetical protein